MTRDFLIKSLLRKPLRTLVLTLTLQLVESAYRPAKSTLPAFLIQSNFMHSTRRTSTTTTLQDRFEQEKHLNTCSFTTPAMTSTSTIDGLGDSQIQEEKTFENVEEGCDAKAMENSLETRGGASRAAVIRKRTKYVRELFAEAVGTFVIVQIGTGAVMSAVITESLVGLFQIAAVWIIGVTIAIAATANISGAHLNPAISLAFVMLRPSESFGWGKLLPYVVAQVFGAVVGSWVNLLMYASAIRDFEAANNIIRSSPDVIGAAKCFGEYFVPPITTAQAFLVEAFGTFVLAASIFALTHKGNETMINKVYVPPLIGMTVGALISTLAPLTQGGFNPARDFGPRIVAYAAGWTGIAFRDCWLYIIAPLVGAPLGGALIDKVLFLGEGEVPSEIEK